MNFEILAEFKTRDFLVRLVADKYTPGDYVVFQRLEDNPDTDVAESFSSKQFANVKFAIQVDKALLELSK